jgi:Fe-S-cluster containining protein
VHRAACDARWTKLQAGSMLDDKLLQMRAKADTRDTEEKAYGLLERAQKSRNAHSKVEWLHKAIDLAVAPSGGLAACRKGCSHCCHISVDIGESEARAIQKTTGRRLNARAGLSGEQAEQRISERQQRALGMACPFLGKAGACSIYEARPFACRAQVNMDEDELLCRLTTAEDGDMPRVPYLNTQTYKAAYRVILGNGERFADIREWFPS